MPHPMGRKRRTRRTAPKTAVDKRQDVRIDKLYRLHEMKHKDTVVATTFSIAASIILLNGTLADDTDTGRNGNKVLMNSFTMKYELIRADVTQVMRVAIVYDRQTNGALPVAADLFQQSTNPLSQHTWVNRKRFKWVYDKVHNLDPVLADQLTETVHFKFKPNAQRIMYSSGVDTVAAIISGSLFVVLLSDSGATTHPSFGATMRVNFNDL